MELERINDRRPLGRTGLEVSALGLGAAQIGEHEYSEEHAGTLLNRAVDMGVTLIDTARGYGLSEARIGRHLSWRRHDYVLCTKVGYGVEGQQDWTPACVEAGVERALRAMRTDYLDVVLLHSCPRQTLQDGQLIEALRGQVRQGKVRAVGYSGEGDALEFAAQDARFDVLECSINITDQRSLSGALRVAQARGAGVIAKRPMANAPWRFKHRPVDDYAEVYWARLQALELEPLRRSAGLSWPELALRFALSWPAQAHSAIVGTANLEHLHRNVHMVNQGPLPQALLSAIAQRFEDCAKSDWIGQI